MKRFLVMCLMLLAVAFVHAQGFPDAQKQPKMKEQHSNQKKYRAMGHRKHVKHANHYDTPAAARRKY